MPNPKRRHSNSRTRMRRAHDALRPRQVAECPQCKKPRLPHTVCSHCGHYDGKAVINVEA